MYYRSALRRIRFEARFLPGERGSPFLGELALAAWTNSSKRFFGTNRMLRMTSLKCWNSEIKSNCSCFINYLSGHEVSSRAPADYSLGARFWSNAIWLASELFVGDAAVNDLLHSGTEALAIVHSNTIVVAKGLLVKIAEQVEWLNTDVGPVKATLQQTPEVLHRISVDVTIDVFNCMVDNCVLVFRLQSIIGLKFITEDRGASLNVLANVSLKFLLPAVANMKDTDLSTALNHPHRYLFVCAASPGDLLRTLVLMHIASLAAYECLVYFNFATKFPASDILHHESASVQHEPCGLLSNPDGSVNFIGTNPVLAVDNLPHDRKPLLKSYRRVLEDSPGLKRELNAVMLLIALPDLLLGDVEKPVRSALGTPHHAVWPAQGHHEVPAMFEVREPQDRITEGIRCFHI
jgi:hypothetical protein